MLKFLSSALFLFITAVCFGLPPRVNAACWYANPSDPNQWPGFQACNSVSQSLRCTTSNNQIYACCDNLSGMETCPPVPTGTGDLDPTCGQHLQPCCTNYICDTSQLSCQSLAGGVPTCCFGPDDPNCQSAVPLPSLTPTPLPTIGPCMPLNSPCDVPGYRNCCNYPAVQCINGVCLAPTPTPSPTSAPPPVVVMTPAPFTLLDPPVYYQKDPRYSGFIPLRYPCNDVKKPYPEFDPLRPYPASPCDPLIPRINPEAPADPDKLYMTFSCNKSAYPQGTMTFPDIVNKRGMQEQPDNDSDMNENQLYICRDDSSMACSLKKVTFTLVFDMNYSRLPIISNTEALLSDQDKVNHYLNWYLNGTVQHSEQEEINPSDSYDMSRVIDFSGPVKKLLALDLQRGNQNLKAIMAGPRNRIDDQIHNYYIDPTHRLNSLSIKDLWVNVPFVTNEDTTGEVNISLHPKQPPQPPINGHIVENVTKYPLSLVVQTRSDSRLYFPQMKNSNALTDILISTYRPLITPTPPVQANDVRLVTQEVDEHQGDDGTRIQKNKDSQDRNPRNTEVIEKDDAPKALFTPNPPECDFINVRTNPGDSLVGSTITANLTYYQVFEYRPSFFQEFAPGCVGEDGNCGSGSVCCWGQCSGSVNPGRCNSYNQAACYPGSCPVGFTRLPYSCQNNNVCCSTLSNPSLEAGSCPSYPTVELDSAASVALFTKTPYIERIYSNLVANPDSLLRRFTPKQFGQYQLNSYLPLTKNETVPGFTDIYYYQTASSLNSAKVDTLNNSAALMYFSHLGSLSDYILGGNPFDRLNLQRTLRPKGYHPYPGFTYPTP